MAGVEKKTRDKIDWEAVERDYRIGQLTVRQIAEKHKCSVAGLMKRAKAEGWERDLTDAVRLATKAKVRQRVVEQVKASVEESRTESNAEVERSTFSEIDLAANVNATIILGQQKRVGKLSSLLSRMTAELEEVTAEPERLEDIAKALEEENPKAAEGVKRLRSLSARMNNLKTATEIMAKLNDAENTAFSIAEGKGGTEYDDMIRQIEAEEGNA